MQKKTIVAVLGILVYAVFLCIGWIEGTFKYYWPDAAFFAAFILFLYFTFRFWRLNVPVYTTLVLALSLHLCGVFGWYSNSPLFIQWDHMTHFFPLFAFTLFLYNFARPWMAGKFWALKTWSVIMFLLLAGFGIGAIIENIEFAGFLALGYGEGGLWFGGAGGGDAEVVTDAQARAIIEQGGGYLNTELDLAYNAFGTIAGVILMSLSHFWFRKKEPSKTGRSFPQEPSPSASSSPLR
ncbi:MAG: hypothetical protein QXM31_00455 [Candidatus Woesearchaeota archaeon]